MGAAREVGLYGMPAIASSLSSFEEEGMQKAVDATVQLIEYVGCSTNRTRTSGVQVLIFPSHMLVDGLSSKIIPHGQKIQLKL